MNEHKPETFRLEHRIIFNWVRPHSRVLDLGCGDGELLARLIRDKSVKGTGIEIDEAAIYACVAKGLAVSHGDIDTGLSDYSSKRFDYVILSESLQQVLHPERVILETLRVGKQVIVTIPNFCHWQSRLQIFFQGRVPVTRELPHEWYDTPNLRFLSVRDFTKFCRAKQISIDDRRAITGNTAVTLHPNLFARIGLFLLHKE